MESSSLRFATAARVLADAARREGLVAPSFRSPPRVAGTSRSVRRGGGEPTVAVRVRGRVWAAVLADLVEGVATANDLSGPDAARWRDDGWRALEGAGLVTPARGEDGGRAHSDAA